MTFLLTPYLYTSIVYNLFCRDGIYFDKILVSEYKLFKRSNKANLFVNVAHNIGSETLFKITGTCGQDPMVPLIAHPSFFFMYTTFCNFLCITVWHIYKKKQSKSSFYPYWVSDICIRFWVFFFETFWAIVYFINTWCEYKYKLAFALAIIQSRRSGCAIVLFLVTRCFQCRIR